MCRSWSCTISSQRTLGCFKRGRSEADYFACDEGDVGVEREEEERMEGKELVGSTGEEGRWRRRRADGRDASSVDQRTSIANVNTSEGRC